MSAWQPIDTAPMDGTPFLGARTVANGRRMGGALFRASQEYLRHIFEQKIDGCWQPAIFTPKVAFQPVVGVGTCRAIR
jgi:hypothetical protein